MRVSVEISELLGWFRVRIGLVRVVYDKLGEALQTQAVVLTFETHVSVSVEDHVARVAEKVGLELGEILPEHVACYDELFVLLVGLYVGRETFDESVRVECFA